VPELRWILTAIGLALIVGVYLWSRRDRSGDDDELMRREPGFGGHAEPWRTPAGKDSLPSFGLEEEAVPGQRGAAPAQDAQEREDEAPALPPEGEQLIVALRLRARQPEGFDGSDLIKAFSAEGLEYGRFGAFHSLDERRRSRFLVASLVEPGSFEIEKMHELRCPGVSMFMVLPGPREPLTALEGMFTCARRLAERLDGEVLDDKGNALTMQHAGWLRERVVDYHRRSKLASSGSDRPNSGP
jgi:cell division protein ZipA